MKFAVQLYSLRGHIKNGDDFFDILEKVKAMGFDGVEFAGYHGVEPTALKAKLDELGLVAVGTHIGLNDYLPQNFKTTLENAKTLGLKLTGVGGAPHSTVEEAEYLAEVLGNAAKIAAEDGIDVYFHNHSDEFTKDLGNNTFAIDIIMNSVKLQLDTYWSFYAGIDNYSFIKENADKIVSFHIKDGVDGTPCALGEGQNDLTSIFKAMQEIGAEWLVLENDNPVPDGLSDIARSMEYLKKAFA